MNKIIVKPIIVTISICMSLPALADWKKHTYQDGVFFFPTSCLPLRI